jgi:HTH-type transcriptional regulator/antitoxin HigA
MSDDFTPDWVSPPGETIVDIICERSLYLHELALNLRLSREELARLLSGALSITPILAYRLSEHVGSTQEFWIQREVDYQKGLARLGLERPT